MNFEKTIDFLYKRYYIFTINNQKIEKINKIFFVLFE